MHCFTLWFEYNLILYLVLMWSSYQRQELQVLIWCRILLVDGFFKNLHLINWHTLANRYPTLFYLLSSFFFFLLLVTIEIRDQWVITIITWLSLSLLPSFLSHNTAKHKYIWFLIEYFQHKKNRHCSLKIELEPIWSLKTVSELTETQKNVKRMWRERMCVYVSLYVDKWPITTLLRRVSIVNTVRDKIFTNWMS
jgi:hypothetical protein